MNHLLYKIKKINLYDSQIQHEIVNEFLDVYDTFSYEDCYFIFLNLRTFFFRYMNNNEKKRFAKIIVEKMDVQDELVYSIIEMLSIMYKYFDTKEQNLIFNKIVNDKRCYECERAIIAITTFFKNTYRVYNFYKQSICWEIIEDMQSNQPFYMQESISYTKDCIHSVFEKKQNGVIIIPEFLSGLSFLQPPLEAIYSKSILEANGYFIDIFDNRVFNYSFQQINEFVKEYDYIVISSSTIDQVITYFIDYRYVLFCKLVNYLKNSNQNKKIIVYGAHGTVKPNLVMKDCKTDILIRGEIEQQLQDVICYISNEEKIKNVDNLVIRNGNELIFTNVCEKKMQSPKWGEYYINYSDFSFKYYYGYKYHNRVHLKKRNWSVIQTTRGCPFDCSFCHNFFGKKIRTRNIKYVIKELLDIQNMGVEEVFILDQTFSLDCQYVQTFCKAILNNNIRIKWYCQTRVGCLDKQTIILMKNAGCITVWLGIESLNEKVISLNSKNYTKQQLLETISFLDECQLNYNAFIMLGMMGETKETMKETIDFIIANRIKLTKSIMICAPRFGTKMYEILVNNLGEEIDSFLKLDAYKGRVNNCVDEDDISYGLSRLIRFANE